MQAELPVELGDHNLGAFPDEGQPLLVDRICVLLECSCLHLGFVVYVPHDRSVPSFSLCFHGLFKCRLVLLHKLKEILIP